MLGRHFKLRISPLRRHLLLQILDFDSYNCSLFENFFMQVICREQEICGTFFSYWTNWLNLGVSGSQNGGKKGQNVPIPRNIDIMS